MRRAPVFAAVLLFSSALATPPGQPLDCSDWVFLEPGITCTAVDDADNIPASVGVNTRGIANDGSQLLVIQNWQVPDATCASGQIALFRTRLLAVRGPEVREVAYVDDRLSDFANCDSDRIAPCCDQSLGPKIGFLLFDAVNGSLYARLGRTSSSTSNPTVPWVARFDGFAKLLDVFQTYVPEPTSLSFRVPAIPEGLPAADHFDTYYGPLTNPIDLAQAQPLQCDYPASPPAPGDYLTVADPLPNPAAGTGRYYLTTVTHAGETRAGRRAVDGVLRGRDPSGIPVCLTP